MAIHSIPRGRDPEKGAEGATTPETLRQKDRDRVMNFWKVTRLFAVSAEGVTGLALIARTRENSQVP